MFSGIVAAVSPIKKSEHHARSLFLTIARPQTWKIQSGDSIATDGTCLTVRDVAPQTYTTELMPETLAKTTFGRHIPRRVNLERSLRLSDRLDGHFVLGHIDAVSVIKKITIHGRSRVLRLSFPRHSRHLVAPKGSITVDGVSLTIVDVDQKWFTVSLVDYTLRHTTLGAKKKGDIVNLEFDILAKYVSKKIRHRSGKI